MEKIKSSYELSQPRLASELYDVEGLRQEAWLLIQNRQEIIHDKWEREPEVNARTALFEELTAKGHLSRIEAEEPIGQTNEKTLKRLVNGWSDDLPDEEKDRRHAEIVEELIVQKVSADIADGLLPADTIVTTISNRPLHIPIELARKIGYRDLSDKGMVRTNGFENGVRVTEQVSRSNSNDGSAERFLAAHGFIVGRDPTRILATQIITTRSHFPDGVIDIQRQLDHFSGPNIIYGEDRAQPDLNVPKYEDLRDVSFDREDQAEFHIKQLADYERQLNSKYVAGKMTYGEKLQRYAAKRREIVNKICVLQPSYAKDARGEASAGFFEQASLAMAAGDDAAGVGYVEKALAAADPAAGIVCGGDGLEVKSKSLAKEASSIFQSAKLERKYWKWKKGLCVVKECPTRPKKVDVGPCSVCQKCQGIFDSGKNPKSVYKTRGFLEWLFQAA